MPDANTAVDPWGWFDLIPIAHDGTVDYALESKRYPGYFLDAYGKNGLYAEIRLVKAPPYDIGIDPWGWFSLVERQANVYSLESKRYPGYYLDAFGSNG